MTPPSPARVFAVLGREALADATRRRIVPLIAAAALFSLFFVDTCTSCSPQLRAGGEPVAASQVQGLLGVAVLLVLGMWTLVLAGVLASDHLAEPLEDGSAALVLSRPVSRGAFALSRLAGVLVLAFATGAVLLSAATWLLSLRQGLAPLPALVAGLSLAAGCVTVGGIAMAASLFLPRVATVLLVFALVWGIALVNVLSGAGARLGGWVGAVDRFGPPLAGAPLAALAVWLEPLSVAGDPADLALRSLAWAAGSAALVVLSFRNAELS